MNHCRDCNSDYTQPGTCNCFAVGGKRYSAPVGLPYTQPWYPWTITPYAPYDPYRPYWGGTITIGDVPGGTATVTADFKGVPITGNFVTLKNALAHSAGVSYTVAGGSR